MIVHSTVVFAVLQLGIYEFIVSRLWRTIETADQFHTIKDSFSDLRCVFHHGHHPSSALGFGTVNEVNSRHLTTAFVRVNSEASTEPQ